MRLNYNILWCEDEAEWFEEASEQIKDYLKDRGFVAVIERVRSESLDELEAKINKSQIYDIILVDYKFNEKPIGAQFIKRIRDHSIYAEIVFYSSVSGDTLHQEVANLKLEGVYLAQRGGGFQEKVKKVIDTTVRKVLDVNAMRGIVMASTADVDKKFFQIIKTFHDQILTDGGKQGELRETLCNLITKKMSDKLTEHQAVKVTDPWKHLSSTANFWSQLRLMTFTDEILVKHFNANKTTSEYHPLYLAAQAYVETSKKRNLLAHEEEVVTTDQNGVVTITVKGFEFNEESSRKLRSDLVDQSTKINEFLERISQK